MLTNLPTGIRRMATNVKILMAKTPMILRARARPFYPHPHPQRRRNRLRLFPRARSRAAHLRLKIGLMEEEMDRIGNLVSLSSHGGKSKSDNAKNEKAAEKAAFAIFSSFRKSDTDDPEVYLAACIRVLIAYPEDVMRAVADPINGIAGKQTYLPSIAELKAELDHHITPILAEGEKRRRYAETEQLLKADPDNPTAEQRARAAERWERTKAEIRGDVVQSQAQARQEAEKHLVELYHRRDEPLKLSAAILNVMVRS